MKRSLTISAFILVVLIAAWAQAVVPDLIPVQGVLTDSEGEVVNENVAMTFRLFPSKTSNDMLWNETKTNIAVVDGVFAVYLGEELPLDLTTLIEVDELWLEILIGGSDSLGRIHIGSELFAIEAEYCRQIGDLYEEDIQPYLGEPCTPGTFFRGWDGDAGAPICNSISAIDHESDLVVVLDDNYAQLTHNHDADYVNENQASSISSEMIADGVITDDDISSSAAIAASKLDEDDPQVGTIANDHIPRWYSDELTTGSLMDDGNQHLAMGTGLVEVNPNRNFYIHRDGVGGTYIDSGEFVTTYGGSPDVGVWSESTHLARGIGVVGVGSAGVYGESTHAEYGAGVWGRNNNAEGAAGLFEGRVIVFGDVMASDLTGSRLETATYGKRKTFSVQSPEVWIEDFGSVQLASGTAAVALEPMFLETVTINGTYPMKVFITMTGASNGVYVTKGTTSFTVTENSGGTSNATFDYRVVAKRKEFEGIRMPESTF